MPPPDPEIDVRMALVERAVHELEREGQKTRARLHKIEPAQRTLLDLIKYDKAELEGRHKMLAEELNRVRADLPAIVRETMLEVFNEQVRDRREGLSVRMQIASVAVAVGGLTAAIVQAIH